MNTRLNASRNSRLISTLSSISALFIVALLSVGVPQPASADDYDPPSRVARLNYIQDSVSFQPAGESDWGPAVLNRPLTTGDRLWTDNGARAELHIGSASIRLDGNTGFSFLNLDDRTVQIELTEGTLNIRVRELDRDEIFEVDTPNQAFSILQPGLYRVEATQDGYTSIVTVRSGQGEVTGGGRTYTVNAGLSGTFYGSDSLEANIYRAGDIDEFDNWSLERDRRFDQAQSARYVSPYVVGYEDLDDYGSWRRDSNYGNVWVPRVSAGWAPYHDGHWAWISPWGWTWIDDAPWGYAPFHYGRWASIRGNWCWIPGPIAVRPVYAPALVVFIGGPSFGLSISIGGGRGDVGWFPLGPREVYVPGYNASRTYVNRVNISNTTVNVSVITNVYNNRNNTRNMRNIRYANRGVPGGVTAVPPSVFTSAQPVGRAAIRVRPRDVASVPIAFRADVAPTRQSVYGASREPGKRVARPPQQVVNRTVVAKTPPPPPPVSFERRQQKLAAQPGRPLDRTEVEKLRPSSAPAVHPNVRQAPPARPATRSEVTIQPDRTRPTPPAAKAPPERPSRGQPETVQPTARPTPPAAKAPAERPSRGQPETVQPTARPTPPAAKAPAERPSRGQPETVQPTARPTPPAAKAPAERPSRGQPETVQPTARPTPPAANAPAERPSRGQPETVQPTARPTPPAANAPAERPSRGQPETVQPTARPTPPAANAPAERPSRGQPETVQPTARPTPPAAKAPPERPSRGQPETVQPTARPTPPAAKAPVSKAPPARNARPDRTNRNQPANKEPAKASGASKSANEKVDRPSKETPQEAKDRKAREKQQNQDGK